MKLKHLIFLSLIYSFNFCLHSMEQPESSSSVDQNSLFIQAAKEGNLELIKQYLQLGKNPDEARDPYGRTALFIAVMEHAKIFMKILTEHNNIIRQYENTHQVTINETVKTEFLAYQFNQSGIDKYNHLIEILLDAGAKVDVRDISEDTPLLFATTEGDLPLVDLLVKYV